MLTGTLEGWKTWMLMSESERKELMKGSKQDGKWIYKKWCCFECSNCGFKIDQYKMHLPPDLYPYCPMCGQKNICK